MKNMTEIISNHSESLEQASWTALGIHDSLERVVASARSWNETLFVSRTFGDYVIRFVGPLATVFLGNYGLPPSLARNAVLTISG
jgi:hypothetical protein